MLTTISRCGHLEYLLLVAVPSDGEAGEEAVLRHAQAEAARLHQGRAQARGQLVNLQGKIFRVCRKYLL